MCGILLEFVFTICQFDKLFFFVNLVDTANNSEVYFFRHFVKLFLCFWGELILNFFLCVLVSRVVGGP